MTRMPRLLGALLVVVAGPLAAQDSGGRCRLELLNVDREHTRITIIEGVVNDFAGGNVRARCLGRPVRMWSDSVAIYGGRIAQFVGRVRYQDSVVEMTADYGTYFRDREVWEARGNVLVTSLRDRSALRGPMLDYYLTQRGVRDTTEMYAEQRPTLTVSVTDSLGAPEEPYLVVGDRVRMRGEDQVWAGGTVTIDRSDFRGRGDSLFLDTGPSSAGALVGKAAMRRTAADSFELTGTRIDLALEQRRLRYLTARDSARLTTADLVLEGDGIGIEVDHDEVESTTAWGKTVRPIAVAPDYLVRGDSLMFDTPGQRLREIRAFGRAWLGTAPDSGTAERDWVAGDTVFAWFVESDTATHDSPALKRLEARGQAQAYYRTPTPGSSRRSVSYSKADLIVVTMHTGDTVTVDSVFALGVKDGIHLQPAVGRPTPPATDTIPPVGRDTIPRFRRERSR